MCVCVCVVCAMVDLGFLKGVSEIGIAIINKASDDNSPENFEI